jgi:putative ABC transport system permease protein
MTTGPGFPAEEFLSAELSVNREQNEAGDREEDSLYTRRATQLRFEVMRRLAAEPNVAGVTFTAGTLGSESSTQIELDDAPAVFEGEMSGDRRWGRWASNAVRVRLAAVDAGIFEAFEIAPLVGRTFRPGDAMPNATAAVVNRTFVDSLLKGGNPIGRKFRELSYTPTGDELRLPWKEIVGVVQNFPAMVDYERPQAVWYAATRNIEPATLQIHVRGTDPLTFANRLRKLTTEVDAGLFLRRVRPLDDVLWSTHLPMRLLTSALIAVTIAVLILSSAGLYALMSVTVTQRRREIGIRIALGADRRRVLTGIFSRAALQVGTGVAVGVVLYFGGGEMKGFNALLILPGVSLFMVAVGGLAALGPARRGLAIQPSAVLKED